MPVFSVLTANYNTPAPFLRRALDSVLEQTFSDFEVVIVNDGSEDESRDVLYEYAAKDARIKIYENGRNLGLPSSLNNGLERCEGEFIARFDTDDICLPDRLENQLEYMRTNPDIMFAGAWADCFCDDESVITGAFTPVMCPPEEYRIRLLFSSAPLLVHPAVVIRRDFTEKNSIRYSEDPAYRYCEDYELWTRLADIGRAGILEKKVIKYRMAENTNRITTSKAAEMRECIYNTQKKLFERLGMNLTREELEKCRLLLTGRKPFDTAYKSIIEKVIKNNDEAHIYDAALLKEILNERWYSIVYYGVAEEKNPIKRTKMLMTLPPAKQAEVLKKRKPRKF